MAIAAGEGGGLVPADDAPAGSPPNRPMLQRVPTDGEGMIVLASAAAAVARRSFGCTEAFDGGGLASVAEDETAEDSQQPENMDDAEQRALRGSTLALGHAP